MEREGKDEILLSSDDEDIPDVSTCQRLVEQFAELTNTDEACAQFFLQDRQWDLERSINAYFEANKGGVKVLQDGAEPEVVVTFDSQLVSALEKEGVVMTEEPPKTFKLISWNIDGLDEKNIMARTKAVARIIDEEKADIVFLQELIPETLALLKQLLPHYLFLCGNVEDYFTATLLLRTIVHHEAHSVMPYHNTQMRRNLLCVEAHIGDLKLHLLNTHLESTGKFARKRMDQLKLAFDKMKAAHPGVTTLFGGDLNLRDKELVEVGLPPCTVDLWEECGRRPECCYTWDITRNTNKQLPGKFKPRLRFDRIYLRKPTTTTATTALPRHFGLIGLQKVSNTQSFPSDHWGIVVHFEIGQVDSGSSSSSSSTSSQNPASTGTILDNFLKRKK